MPACGKGSKLKRFPNKDERTRMNKTAWRCMPKKRAGKLGNHGIVIIEIGMEKGKGRSDSLTKQRWRRQLSYIHNKEGKKNNSHSEEEPNVLESTWQNLKA